MSSTSTQKAANTTEIVKLIMGAKKALQLEDDLADFTIFMLNAELIKTGDLEHKNVFRDEDKMITTPYRCRKVSYTKNTTNDSQRIN